MNICCPQCFATNRIPAHRDFNLANCGKCKHSLQSMTPIDLSDTSFFPYIERSDLPIIVDFWASWCGPCQQMTPVFNQLAYKTNDIMFAKVNTEQAQQIAAQANIRSIPTLIFFHQGKEVDRVSGGLNEAQMKQWIMQCVQKLT